MMKIIEKVYVENCKIYKRGKVYILRLPQSIYQYIRNCQNCKIIGIEITIPNTNFAIPLTVNKIQYDKYPYIYLSTKLNMLWEELKERYDQVTTILIVEKLS